MARYAVKKVDSRGVVIKNFKTWRLAHPDALYFDSKLEYNFYVELKRRGLNFEYQVVYRLQPSFKFTDWCIRTVKGEGKKLGWYQVPIQGITWTVDYLLTDYNIVVEAKGVPNDSFPNKLKMFKYYVHVNNLGIKVVVLHSVKELTEFLDNGLNG